MMDRLKILLDVFDTLYYNEDESIVATDINDILGFECIKLTYNIELAMTDSYDVPYLCDYIYDKNNNCVEITSYCHNYDIMKTCYYTVGELLYKYIKFSDEQIILLEKHILENI